MNTKLTSLALACGLADFIQQQFSGAK